MRGGVRPRADRFSALFGDDRLSSYKNSIIPTGTARVKYDNRDSAMTRILLVDDDPNTTQLLQLMLSKDGYQVFSVNNSRETLSAASGFSPDLILIDLMMPEMDGIEVCKALRAHPPFEEIPILFFTAVGDTEHKVAAYEAGASDFFTKPIHPEELRLKIKALARRGHTS